MVKNILSKLAEIHLTYNNEESIKFPFVSVELVIPGIHVGSEFQLDNRKVRIIYVPNALQYKESNQQEEV